MARTSTKTEEKKTTGKKKASDKNVINETVNPEVNEDNNEVIDLNAEPTDTQSINEVVTGDTEQEDVSDYEVEKEGLVRGVDYDQNDNPVDDQINEEGFHEGTEHGVLDETPNEEPEDAGEPQQINEELQAEREIGYQNGGAGQIVDGDLSGHGLEQMPGLTLNNPNVEKLDSFQKDIEPVYFDMPDNPYQKKVVQYNATSANDCRVYNDATPDYMAQCPPKEKTEKPGAYVAQRPY